MQDTEFGELSVIGMRGCDSFTSKVDYYLKDRRGCDQEELTYILKAECPRFGTGEGKGLLHESVRGHDIYIVADVFNHGVTYKMYGQDVPMSPDDHYADLKRIIAATQGKARRITVIMPMLYEGRQHKRSSRESLDCALMLQELVNMGVSNIITFDAHDSRVQNAIPLSGFDDVRPTYQMIKALIRNVPDVQINKESLMIISPDEGAMSRCMYFSSVLGVDIGMFYKRRNYAVVVNGRNPIEAHEYLGRDLSGMDVIIVDDMISSGESMIDVAAQLKQRGAKRIFSFASFGLFTSGPAVFDKAHADGIIDKVFTTNLVYTNPEVLTRDWYVPVDMSKFVAYIIDTLNHDATLSELLNPVKKIHAIVDKHKKEQEAQITMNLK